MIGYDRKASEDEILSTPRGVFDRKVNAKHAEAGKGGWFATPTEMRKLWETAVREAAEYRASKKQSVAPGQVTKSLIAEVAWACRVCGRSDLPMWRGRADGLLRCTECVADNP